MNATQAVFEYIKLQGKRGATRYEIADALGMSFQAAGKRITYLLYKKKMIKESDIWRGGPGGKRKPAYIAKDLWFEQRRRFWLD